MQTDPMEEWRRLTSLYGEMGDVEIRELADQIGDLTPNAQQILRDELKKRGWSNDGAKPAAASRGENDAVVRWDQEQDTAADGYGEMSGGDQASDYSWKVALCRCDSLDEAAARGEMLRRAGIDCWIQRPGARSVVPWLELGVGDIQINVAADQLDQAKLIVAQPIPQAILDEVSEQNATPLTKRRCVRSAEPPIRRWSRLSPRTTGCASRADTRGPIQLQMRRPTRDAERGWGPWVSRARGVSGHPQKTA